MCLPLCGVDLLAATGPNLSAPIGAEQTLFAGAVSAFVTTLVVGALLLTVLPEYTERMTDEVFRNPVVPFLYGTVVLSVLVSTVLALSTVGISFAILPTIALGIVWATGSSTALLAVADRLIAGDDGWLVPLLATAVINAGLALSGAGGLISLGLGALGCGTILSDRHH